MPGHDDLWDILITGDTFGGRCGSMDNFLSSRDLEGEYFTGVRNLTDKYRAKSTLGLPVEAGTRVEFQGNTGAVLTYADPPVSGSQGTVVTVRSSTGDVTDHEGKVFVKWDDGNFLPIYAEHLKASSLRSQIRVASLGDITGFLRVAEDTLIHRSTKDLWSFRKEGPEYVIERLFDSTGAPLKW